MPVTIDSLFGLQEMGESVALFKDPTYSMQLQSLFESEDCHSDVYRYDREVFPMAIAPITGRKATSIEVKSRDRAPQFLSLVHIKVHKKLYAADLFTMRAAGEI